MPDPNVPVLQTSVAALRGNATLFPDPDFIDPKKAVDPAVGAEPNV
jgi:hypothetical protein